MLIFFINRKIDKKQYVNLSTRQAYHKLMLIMEVSLQTSSFSCVACRFSPRNNGF